MSTPLDTGKVPRRKLKFATIDDLLAELDRLAQADQAGTLKTFGNWTFGQNLHHLAVWAEYAFSGAPMNPPWIVKAFLKTFVGKRKFIHEPMRAGVKIPGIAGGTLAIDDVATETSLPRYRAVLQRLRTEAPRKPQVIFGPLSHEEWIQLNLRHAELHLSFCSG